MVKFVELLKMTWVRKPENNVLELGETLFKFAGNVQRFPRIKSDELGCRQKRRISKMIQNYSHSIGKKVYAEEIMEDIEFIADRVARSLYESISG